LFYGRACSHQLDSHIMSINQYLNYIDQLYFYKCLNGLIDSQITDSIRAGGLIRGQNDVYRLIPPLVRTTLYQKGFLFRATALWNNLPSEVKTSYMTYQKLLKAHCFAI
jgi:hypothetical protein